MNTEVNSAEESGLARCREIGDENSTSVSGIFTGTRYPTCKLNTPSKYSLSFPPQFRSPRWASIHYWLRDWVRSSESAQTEHFVPKCLSE